MATTTPNYGLRKPTNADTVNVATDISANMDLIDAHAHSGTYVATVGVSSGTDDTAAINALLAANLNVKGLPGQTYIISTPLIIRSGSTLDMTGCTINLKAGSNCQMIYNQAYTAARRLVDGAISATATFVAGDVGKTVFIWGAGQQGEILRTTITARTNGTTVTVADAALSTVTGQTFSVGPRDSDITITGGIWDRGSNVPGAANLTGQSILFRSCDNLTLTSMKGKSAAGWYFYSLADVTDFTVDKITFDVISDGVHITGPARRGVISNIRGHCYDDMVSLTATDWPGKDDVYGDIDHVTVEHARSWSTSNTVAKVLGGSNTTPRVTAARHIRFRNISGYADNSTEGSGGLVWIGDDSGLPITAGGFLDDILVENVAGTTQDTGAGKNNLVYINATNAGRITVGDLAVNVPAAVEQHGVYVAALANVEQLVVRDIHAYNCASTSDLVRVVGSAATLIVERATAHSAFGGTAVNLTTSTSNVYRLFLADCDLRGGYAFVKAAVSGARLDVATISNCQGGPLFFVAELNCTSTLQLNNINAGLTNSTLNLGSAAVVTVQSANVSLNGKSPLLAGGASLKWRTTDFPSVKPVTGQYACPPRSADGAGTPAQNVAYYTFLPIDRPCTIDRVGIEVITGVAATTIRLGILADNDGAPGAVLVDAGAVTTTSSGASAEATVSVAALPPGVWLASDRQSASGASVRVCQGGALPIYTRSTLTVVTGFQLTCLSEASRSGAFAANPTGLIGDANAPIVAVRFA